MALTRAATITNTNVTVVWDSTATGWKTTIANPWGSINGNTNTALFTNSSTSISITNTGVWANGVSLTNSNAGFAIGGGTLTFGGTSPTILVSHATSTLTLSNPIQLSGASTLTKSGSGTLVIAGSNALSGTVAVSASALMVSTNGWLGNSTITIGASNSAPYLVSYGTVGTVIAPSSPSSSNANVFLSNSTVRGQLTLSGASNGLAVYGYGSNSPAGYATVATGSILTNALVNGRLDITGSGSLSISGVSGQTNGVNSPLLTGFRGSGLLVVSNTWTNGGAGNSLGFAPGRNDFSALLIGPGAFVTLTQSGSSTTTFAVFGSGQASNSRITLNGGTWLLGCVGRSNANVLNLSTNVITGNASVTVSNTGFDGGVWNVTQGSLTMVGNVLQKNFPQQSFCVNVEGAGAFNVTGTFRLANSLYTNATGYTNRLMVDGGTAVIASNTSLGMSGTITNDTSIVTVTNAGSLLIWEGLTVGDMGADNSGCVQRILLAGGELLVAQILNAGSFNATCTNGLLWSGGQLSAYTVVATNPAWNDPASSIRSGVLSNASGTLAPGDIGTPGLNTIRGSYVQAGGGTLSLDLGGTNVPTLFQHTNAGFSDRVDVSGSATLGGAVSATLCQGYVPQTTDIITVMTASNGISGSFANVPIGKSVNVDGTNGFILGTNGNALVLSSYHRLTPPVITSQPSAQSAALGGTASFSVTSTSPTPQTYQWRFEGSAIAGATNPTLLLTNLVSSQAGSYDVVIDNADGTTNSLPVSLAVLRLSSISTQPASRMAPSGAPVLFSVMATSSLTITYQWRFNGANIAGATNSTYAIPSVQSSDAGTYDVVTTTSEGSLTSAPAELVLISGSLLSVTNTNLSAGWNEGGSNWSSAPVTNPFSSANGAYVAAVFTNGFGSIVSVNPGGVTVNTLTYSNSSGSLLLTGGGIGFAGNAPSLAVQSGSLLQFGSSSSLGVVGGGTITKSGSGGLIIDGVWNGTGTLAVQQGSLSVGSSGDLSSSSVILTPLTSMSLNGTAGNIRVGGNGNTNSISSAGLPNFAATNAVIRGSLVIDPPPDAGKMAYAAPNMPASSVGTNYGYGTLAGTMTVSNLVVGGRLDIIGNQPMNISVSGGFTNGPTNLIGRGSGVIVNFSRNTSTNAYGGIGNVITFTNGAVLAGFFNSTNSTATLVGSGTATIGMFGQGAGNLMGNIPAGSLTFLNGGTWNLGQVGQGNTRQCAAGNFVLTNGAAVTVGGNILLGSPATSHGTWTVQQGTLRFLSAVSEGGGAEAALIHTLQLRVATNGILTVNGNLQLGVSGSSGVVTGPPSELSIRGGSGTLTGLLLGNGNSATATVSDGVVNALLESGSLSIGANGLCVGYDGANLISGASNSFLLSGGKLLVAGNLRAGSSPGQANSFRWTGGQLTAATVTATNSGWSDPLGSIRSGTLYQDSGVIAPGDVGKAGLTTVMGDYVQASGAFTDIDIGGTSAATSFTNGPGFHDRITVSGAAVMSGSLRIRILPGFTPSSTNVFQIFMASNGVSGAFSNALSSGRYATEDGTGSFVVTMASNMVTLGSFSSATPPVITSQPQSVQSVAGSDVTLSVIAYSTNLPITYQWRFNGVALPGSTNSSLTLTGVDASVAGSYDVVISSPESMVTSASAQVSLAAPPTFTLQPSPVTVSNGQNVLLTASVSSSLPYTLQWRRNGVPIAGATNTSLSIASATVSSSGSYDLVATSAAGNVVSDPAAVTVLPLTYAPMQGIAAVAGSSNSINVSITSSSTAGYQWKKDGLVIAGATNPALSFPSLGLSDAGLYSVTITNALGSLTTEEVAVVVVRPFSNPTALFYPLSNAPVSGTNRVDDFSGSTAGTLITPVTNVVGSTTNYSRIMATNLPSLLTNEPIPSGRAWDFSQTPSYVTVPQSGTNPIPLIGDIGRTDGVSLAFWVNFDFYNAPVATRDNRRIISVANGTTIDVRTGHTAGLHKGIISAYFGNNANIPQFFVSTPAASTTDNAVNGQWHHVAVTVDYTQSLNNVRLYVDGTNVVTQTEPVTASFNTTNQPVFLGGRDNNQLPTQLQGRLAMLGIFTRALTRGEINQLVTLPAIANFAPTVAAESSSHILEWPAKQVNLLGIATDDGVPAGQGISYQWTQVSGNGNVSFEQATNPSTAASFSSPGTYVLRLTASDGQYANTADVTVNVSTNAPPVVYTGASTRTAASGSTISLTGGATDDGLPISGGGALSYYWSQISGPASVSFASPSSNNTQVTLPTQPGDYVFGLTVSDGYKTSSNSVTVTVVPALPPVVKVFSTAPLIDLNAASSTVLAGSASGSGSLSYSWTQVSGPSASIASSGSSSSPVILNEEGDYQFRLTVGNGVASSSSDLWVSAVKSTPGVPFPSASGTNLAVNMGSSTPAPFVHPRIFFTEEDRPALRAAITDTNNPVATNAIAQLRAEVTNSIDKPTTPIGAAYARLKLGDPEVDIQGVAKLSDVPYRTFQGTASSGLYGVLASACYLAWLDQDNPATQQRLKDLATAVATAARQHSTWYLYDRMYWSGSTDPAAYSITSYDVYSDLALCYDFIYNWMTEEQRGVTRKLLADMTYGRLTQGATEEDYVLSTNHRIFHDHLVIAQLAIEGEPGYDPVSVARNRQKLKSYFNVWGIAKEGFNREGPGYFAFGMHNGTPAAYALSRRGENLFVTSHLYASFQEYFYQMAPDDSGKMYGHHDGAGWGNGSVSSTYYAIMKSVYPTDPYIDHVYRKGWENNVYSRMPLTCAIFARPFVTSGKVREVAAAKGMPPSIFSAQRGIGVSRSDWSTNAIFVDYDCRGDTMQLGHLHSDRNSFTMYALGREWFMGQGYHLTENDSKQTVLIDGLGAAGSSTTRATNSPLGAKWPSLPGKFLEFSDSSRLTLMAGDSAPSYNYSWSTINFNDPKQIPANSTATPYRWRDLFYPGMQFPKQYKGDDTWLDTTIRADATPYNPVSKAFRTLMLVRGGAPDPNLTNAPTYPRSYTLILDDISSQDTNTHGFTWSGNTISHYDVTDMALTNATTNTAVMYHTGDLGLTNRPQMLIAVAHANGSAPGPISLDSTSLDNGEGPQATLRVQVTRTNTVSPDFKILLYPHLNGEVLPTTSYTNTVTDGVTNGTLTVNLPDGSGGWVTDVFRLRPQSDGRTRVVSYAREGATPPVITVPPGVSAVTGSNATIVNFSVAASDSSGNPVATTVNPPSGSPFPIGTTLVTVSASDAQGNTATETFNVTVSNPVLSDNWRLTQVGPTPSVGPITGSAGWDTNSGLVQITGRGAQFSSQEAFTLLSRPWTGDGVLTARLVSVTGFDPAALGGLVIRSSTNAGAVGTALTMAGNVAQFRYRTSANGSYSSVGTGSLAMPEWLRLARRGTSVMAYVSDNGEVWTQVGSTQTIALPTNSAVEFGLAAAPNTVGYSSYATFDNVSLLDIPLPPSSVTVTNSGLTNTVSWTASPGATGYRILRSTSAGGPFVMVGSVTNVMTYRDIVPSANASYFYRVAADNGSGSGGSVQSSAVSVQSSAVSVPTASQTIDFAPLGTKVYSDGLTIGLGATASSGLTVSYASADTNLVSISGTNLTVLGAGTATIVAYQAGDSNYSAATPVTNSLVVDKGIVVLTITGTNTTYDGAAKAVMVAANPTNAAPVIVTYSNSIYPLTTNPPTNAGSYAVTAMVTDTNYSGSTNGTFMIAKAIPIITIGSTNQPYNGSPRPVAIVINPTNLPVLVTYDGSPDAPSAVGSYKVEANVDAANYSGTNGSTLRIYDPVSLWRQAYFGTTSASGIAADTADPNGNGLSNIQDYTLGIDPVTPTSGAPISITASADTVTVTFLAREAGNDAWYTGLVRHYSLEGTTNLTNSSWTNLPGYSDITGAGQTITFSTNNQGFQKWFFRLRAWLQ